MIGASAIEQRLDDGTEVHLFLPDDPRPVPAVMILHERYGLVQHTLDLAARLARDGYVALAPNLFSHWQGDQEALKRGDVRVVLPDDDVAATVERCLDFLHAHPRVRGGAVALMGVCQSGRYPVVVAARRRDVAACVSFYGASQKRDWDVSELQPRPMEELLAEMRAPALFVFGEADHTISIEDVRRVRDALEVGRCSYRMKVFADMPHGWLNDTMPGRYRAAEAEQAWDRLLEFLGEVFRGAWPRGGRVVWEFESDISVDYDFSKNVRLE